MAYIDRIFILDYIRAIAAVFVVLYHYTTRYGESIGHVGQYSLYFPDGYYGVVTFFIVSGFAIFFADRNITWRMFLYKRCSRILPAYWSSIVITFFVVQCLLPEKGVSISTAIANFFVFHSYFGLKSVDGAYWTMPVFIVFYCLFSVFAIGKRDNRILKTILVWIALSLVINIALNYEFTSNVIVKATGVFLIREYAHAFILGILSGYLYSGARSWITHAIIVLCVCNSLIMHSGVNTLFYIFMVILFYGIGYKWKLLTVNSLPKVISLLSDISYPLYLVHQYIGWAIIRNMELRGYTNELWILVPIVVSIGLATCLHYAVEIPSQKWLRKNEWST